MNHCLNTFRFCPKCGAEHFTINDSRSKCCPTCGFTYYQNTAAATVAVIVSDDRKILCTRRAANPAKGTLDLPGGFAEFDESLEACCLREVKEESGAEVKIRQYLFSIPNTYEFSGFTVKTLDAFFLCEMAEGASTKLSAADDAAELLWIPFAELKPADFGLTSIRKGIERIKKLY